MAKNFVGRNLESTGNNIKNFLSDGKNEDTPAQPTVYQFQMNGPMPNVINSGIDNYYSYGGVQNSTERPLNFFNKDTDGSLWEVVNADKYLPTKTVVVYAHGSDLGITINRVDKIRTSEILNELLTSRSQNWRDFRKHNGKLTLVLKACNVASKLNPTDFGTTTNMNFTRSLSIDFPSLTVIGASGFYVTKSIFGFNWEAGVNNSNGKDT